MTDWLINYISDSENDTTVVSKKHQQFAMLSQNKYQFENYLLDETHSLESKSDIDAPTFVLDDNQNNAAEAVMTNDYIITFKNKNHETGLYDLRHKVMNQACLNISKNTEINLIQQVKKFELVLESLQQPKISQLKNNSLYKEIDILARKLVQQEQLDTEYVRIVRDRKYYKLYLNIDANYASTESIKQLVTNIEQQRGILFSKVYLNREVIFSRDEEYAENKESFDVVKKSTSINYTI